jgi:prepilin-type N-terminal cleavage/methylation domain-containing protein
MRRSRYNHNEGFTLAEIVVTLAVVAVVGIIIAKFQVDVFSFNRTFHASFSTVDQAQKLLRPMTAEIRSASQSSNGAYPIDAFAANDFAFYSDINNDGFKDWVRYYVSGTTMYKEVIAPSGTPLTYSPANKKTYTFMTGVRNISDGISAFQYYSSSYIGGSEGEVVPGTGNVQDIRLIKITVRLDADPQKPPAATDVTSQVSIRNLKQQ